MECFSPLSLPDPSNQGNRLTVPCNNCPACLARLRSGWAFRLSQEWKQSVTSHFITITYNDQSIPMMMTDDGELNASLNKSQIQLFLKRLRKAINSEYLRINPSEIVPENKTMLKIRYYLVGEYGTKTHRPHYHILLFNLPNGFINLVQKSWTENDVSLGHCYTGSVSDRSINYCAGYIINRKTYPKNVEPPFSLMSRKPGIGHSYLEKMSLYHQENSIFQGTLPGGIKVSLPRYYTEKLFNKISREHHRSETLPKIWQKQREEYLELVGSGLDPGSTLEARKQQILYNFKKRNKKSQSL